MLPEPPRQAGMVSAFFASVRGRVQRVGFRYSALLEARRLGLAGWVRNTRNGDVEVWAEGAPEKLDIFLAWLRRGPPGARVDSLFWEARPPAGTYPSFSVE